MNNQENPGNFEQLLAARDAALRVAQAAIRDSTCLTRMLTILSDPTSLELILDRALSTLSELFLADIVVLLDPARNGSFAPLAAIGLPEDILLDPFVFAPDSYIVAAMNIQTPVLLTEMDTDLNVDVQLRDLGAMTGVYLPVIGNYTARGVLIMARCQPVPFVYDEVGLLTALTYRIGLLLEQNQRSDQLRQVVRLGYEIGRDLDEATVYNKTVSGFPAVIGADSAALFLKHSSGELFRAADYQFDPAWGAAWTALARYLIYETSLDNLHPHNISNVSLVFEQQGIQPPPGCPVSALVAVPILSAGQVQGMLMGMRWSAILFTPDTLQMAMLYTGQTSSAIENASLYRSVQDELAERKAAEQALRASDERFRALISSVSDVISVLTVKGEFSYVSPAVEDTWGCSLRTLLSQNIFDRVHPEDADEMRNLLAASVRQPNVTLSHILRLYHGGGRWRDFEVILTNLLDDPAVGGIVGTFHDITESKSYEQELRKLAFLDPLTGLSNRAHFTENLTLALTRADADNRSVAVIFFDLDNFKVVNDTLGHAWGDRVLRIISDRLQNCLRKEDTVARFGGDEFTVLVEGLTTLDQVLPIVHRVLGVFKEPIQLKDREFLVGGSLGIALSDPHQDSADDLLRKADLAMYEAKSKQKGSYAVFKAK